MDQILLCSNQIPSVTTISNSFIQDYMLQANGSYVKVYLYLAMCIQENRPNLSISSLADQMENTEKDIIRALQYWEKQELISLHYDNNQNISGLDLIAPANNAMSSAYNTVAQDNYYAESASDSLYESNETFQNDSEVSASEEQISSDISHTKDLQANNSQTSMQNNDSAPATDATNIEVIVTPEQTARLAEDETFSWICLIVESYLERPLLPTEIQLLTYLFDNLHFSKDLILYLYEYCCSLHKTNVRYVQTVALSWAEKNITTRDEAEELSVNYSAAHTAIAKSLALGRTLAKIECEYVERWQNEWHMDLAVILEACNRTMLSIQKPDFKYLDGILSKWKQQNVHTLQDVQLADTQYHQKKAAKQQNATSPAKNEKANKPNQFHTFLQRETSSDEINQLEKRLLNRK